MNHCVTEFLPLMLIRTAGLPLRWPGCSIDRVEVWMEMYVTALNQLRATQQLASSAFEMEKECLLSDSQLQKTMTNTRRRLRSKMDDSAFPIDSLLREQRPDLSRLLDDLNEKIAHKELVFSQLKGNFAEWVQEERKKRREERTTKSKPFRPDGRWRRTQKAYRCPQAGAGHQTRQETHRQKAHGLRAVLDCVRLQKRPGCCGRRLA